MKVEELIEKMKKGVVEFKFKKSDGTIRTAHGTLVSSFLPELKGTGKEPSPMVCVYWDTDKNAWRSFRKECLM